MDSWRLCDQWQHLRSVFGSIDQIFNLTGQQISHNLGFSEVVLVEAEGRQYYVKRYYAAGKGIRYFIGTPRIEREWQNLQRFDTWGIPTSQLVAYGMEYRHGIFHRGALVTAAIPHSTDLVTLARNCDPHLQDKKWVNSVSHQLAAIARTLHSQRFIHGDLKWRNILVGDDAKVFLIDSPCGRTLPHGLLQYHIVKELANIDRNAKQYGLRRSQRLRFFLQYLGQSILSHNAKRQLRRILAYRFRRDEAKQKMLAKLQQL
ncbi:lipopolysaccharide kinase InaA family protein [Methylobacillus caricis]|uniref:lipopolysaccharide kinase InaA family protein n=1 Tax=Methylobacillus caricis TaxID=1971611 RepID=UPI001D000344|nr:lipopolysaccharide kinase InaA family protein [Methylobacillus caricis]MCB5187180.1 lipopolysaccharide kinase InaA family protein [Methylobacillus caricis]